MKRINRRTFLLAAAAAAPAALGAAAHSHAAERPRHRSVQLTGVSVLFGPLIADELRPGRRLKASVVRGKVLVSMAGYDLGWLPAEDGRAWGLDEERRRLPELHLESVSRDARGRLILIARVRGAKAV
jgi:hypothetical protein